MRVQLRTYDGQHYVVAESGGGGVMRANRAQASIWETFTLVPVGGATDVIAGGQVGLQT
jgi:hypothetical protein